MNVLVIGQGGREHALVWKIAQSQLVDQIYCWPGNPGMEEFSINLSIPFVNEMDSYRQVVEFVKSEGIDLTIVGPEDPLANGIVDLFELHELNIFGPNQSAAQIEASKDFAKKLMKKYDIPTADYQTFTDAEAAIDYVKKLDKPVFVKADGLAAGKGAIPGPTISDAIQAIRSVLVEQNFGEAGQKVVIEEWMEGEEASFIVLSDGNDVVTLPTSQDHKRAMDNDQGPNTGGMGAYSPAPVITDILHQEVIDTIVLPTIKGMKAEGRIYKGILYVGLMITDQGPKVVEYNCRLGDPEAQVLIPRIESDLVPILQSCLDGTLAQTEVKLRPDPAVCVVMASGGYPKSYEKGKKITGVESFKGIEHTNIFHAGTSNQSGELLTDGGRVLGVTSVGSSIQLAIDRAYQGISKIDFDQAHYRTDIAHRAVERTE